MAEVVMPSTRITIEVALVAQIVQDGGAYFNPNIVLLPFFCCNQLYLKT